ncbi:biotin--acetyl-CoA-carboxylase ligase [Anoxybacillus gonensis]|uniref:Bifunctional ligase/repressor BirA n=1 Tax=Anoxybacillus gonensis TaxID=198467 RepID=A0AAW7TFP5_9BACL|nr:MULTISPECIES: bifunctional biotin--[acetyl-CoA-carboxylase] synthetase/biotin operon repressor [Anoxybacillus]AXM90091.1 bifunctional biotin--[acetyl-CoA-carboxylase] synthetase/biotin operon repressor [Anoxybacillus ayderensis G10]MBW9218190.1 bifunctional biotin--[acetyl-CoA-carboxylase] synthetase/biotin operon repressor [Anoxybacillus sp. ST70]THD15840.1 bifunctional biotin--[acetyl-CoA-carboxylase] synthetase/biotin operon repressor [Anoxybacillus ayderensis]AKS38651.1 biotin--acetyl-Co
MGGVQSETRKQLLKLFTEAGESFLSGQKISEQLGCSRTAVWKHIEDLRKEGFEVEAVRRLGYRLKQMPDKLNANELQLGLKTKRFGWNVYDQESVPSTQQLAHQLAHEGAEEGTIVIAEEQTAGRGRLNRSWHSPKGTGIWMSIILRPSVPPQQAPQLTLLVAVAVAQAIQEVTNIVPDIKWPNDVLINGKKVVGILTELQADPDQVRAVIVGIGMNVNQTQFPSDIASIATSLAIETGRTFHRPKIVQTLLQKLEQLYEQYLQHGFLPIKLLWEGYSVTIGQQIVARTLNGAIRGVALGITDSGTLKVQTEDGAIHYVYSADIEIKKQ